MSKTLDYIVDGECVVCHGEIPEGHDLNCGIRHLEKQIREQAQHIKELESELSYAISREAPQWISVDERLPDTKEPVVYLRVSERKMSVGIAYWTVSKQWHPEAESVHAPTGFTHWMPLPAPPEEQPK